VIRRARESCDLHWNVVHCVHILVILAKVCGDLRTFAIFNVPQATGTIDVMEIAVLPSKPALEVLN
jgi:hypothetical protein